jgi:hypothetical protein
MSEPYAPALFSSEQTEAIQLHLSVARAVKDWEFSRDQFHDETGEREGTWRMEVYRSVEMNLFLHWWTPTVGSAGLNSVTLQNSGEDESVAHMPDQYEALMGTLCDAL